MSFDAANAICATDLYVRIAIGLDYLEAAPVRGSYYGAAEERLDVKLKIDGARQTREEDIVAESRGDPKRLPAHLTTGEPKLRHGLHCVQPRVERDPAFGVLAMCRNDRDGHRSGVGRPLLSTSATSQTTAVPS